MGRSPLTLPADLTAEETVNPVKPIDSIRTSVAATGQPNTELVSQPSDQSRVPDELVERSICEQLIGAGLEAS